MSKLVRKISICSLVGILSLVSVLSFAQQKKKISRVKKVDQEKVDTIQALVARQEWQFPIRAFLDEVITRSQKSRRPILAFDVDFADPTNFGVRDSLLRDPDVMIYLSKNFELALHDFSVDPSPSVGFDSLGHLGKRLDLLEKRFNIESRPTAILLAWEGFEIERIPLLQLYSPQKFIAMLKDFLSGRNTIHALSADFWSDQTNLEKHKRYLDRLMERMDYDSITYHYKLLATDSSFGQTPEMMKNAAAQYAYIRFKQEGNVNILKQWIFSLDKSHDSALIVAGIKDILEHYQNRKKIDSIGVYYEKLFSFTNYRDPDYLNNYAWDLANFSIKYDEALRIVNEAITQMPKNASYYDTRALVYAMKKDFAPAIADAETALKFSDAQDLNYFKERVSYFTNLKTKIEASGDDQKK
ncbi:MAG: hypothetical protein WCH46_03080 [bacterium]